MRKHVRLGLAAGAGTVAMVLAAALAPVSASATSPVPSVTAVIANGKITLSTGTTLHAGRVLFRTVAYKDDHVLQLLKLNAGYTLQQAMADVSAGLENGNVAAIRRVDTRIQWLGGAEAAPGNTGYFAETLYAGDYYLIDQNSPVLTKIHVYGTPPDRAWIANNSTVRTVMGNRFSTPATMPRSGWTLFSNTSDEPHFIAMQQVKPGTTTSAVAAYFSHPTDAPPSWAMPAQAGSAVVSPQRQVLWHYDLPAGRYLVACWWPDDENGMPHAMMGMWKLVDLR